MTKNLMRRPECTLFILDPAGPCGAKYKAHFRVTDQPGQGRVVVRIKPARVNAVNMRG